MCLIVLAYQTDPEFPFVVAANRDEFYQRSSDPIGFWSDNADLLAGRDHDRGGIWLGITRNGRFAAVTNIREGFLGKRFPVSRGDLARGFLTGNLSPEAYVKTLQPSHLYGGFHLLLGDQNGLFHFSNRANELQPLEPGVHGVSNHLFDDSWPKTATSKQGMGELMGQREIGHHALQELMMQQPIKAESADSNLEYSEQNPFLWGKEYGTCATSTLMISRNHEGDLSASMKEQCYRQFGEKTGNRRFDFKLT